MKSTIVTEQQVRDFCAMMTRDFGIQIETDNELIPVFMVSFMAAKMCEKTAIESRDSINKIVGVFEVETRKTIYETHEKLYNTVSEFEKSTAEKIGRIETKQIRFGNKKEAFYYGFGTWGLPLLVGVILLFSAYFFVNHKQEQEKPGIQEFVESAKIETKFTNTGSLDVLRLYPAADMSKAIKGTHYVYNKACNCIEIPISYQLK